MWNHITQTLQLVSLAHGLMSLWKCATHSSLSNFSCTDERGREMWVQQLSGNGNIVCCNTYCSAASSWAGTDNERTFRISSWTLECLPFSLSNVYTVKHSVYASKSSVLALLSSLSVLPGRHHSVSLWTGCAYCLAARPECLCVNRQPRAKHCQNTMDDDKRTN